MPIERIVRPAQYPDNQPPRVGVTRRTAANWQPVKLKFGVGGSLKTVNASISQTLNFYHKKRPTEKNASGGSFLGITFP